MASSYRFSLIKRSMPIYTGADWCIFLEFENSHCRTQFRVKILTVHHPKRNCVLLPWNMKHSWYRSECKRQKKVGVDLVVAEVAKQQGKRMESGQPISATPRVTAAVHGTRPGGRRVYSSHYTPDINTNNRLLLRTTFFLKKATAAEKRQTFGQLIVTLISYI